MRKFAKTKTLRVSYLLDKCLIYRLLRIWKHGLESWMQIRWSFEQTRARSRHLKIVYLFEKERLILNCCFVKNYYVINKNKIITLGSVNQNSVGESKLWISTQTCLLPRWAIADGALDVILQKIQFKGQLRSSKFENFGQSSKRV